MTSLINPNDEEIKQKIIKCYDIIYENEYKSTFLDVIDRYYEKHKILNIDKDKLIKYINSNNLDYQFERLIDDYKFKISENTSHGYTSNREQFNKLMLNITINSPYDKELYKEAFAFFNQRCFLFHQEENEKYKYIYYNIYNLFKFNNDNKSKTTILNKSIKYSNMKINKLKDDFEFINNSNQILKDDNEFIKNSIKDLKYDNEFLNNFVINLDNSNQIIKEDIKDVKNDNEFIKNSIEVFIKNSNKILKDDNELLKNSNQILKDDNEFFKKSIRKLNEENKILTIKIKFLLITTISLIITNFFI